jgi:hypothetical protein
MVTLAPPVNAMEPHIKEQLHKIMFRAGSNHVGVKGSLRPVHAILYFHAVQDRFSATAAEATLLVIFLFQVKCHQGSDRPHLCCL